MELIYLLPNGSRAPNMKTACEELDISSHAFRRLVKSGIIKKIDSEDNWSKEYGNELQTANSRRTKRNWI